MGASFFPQRIDSSPCLSFIDRLLMHSEYMDTLGVCDDAQACLDVMGDIHDKTSQALSQSRSSSRAIWRNSFAIAAGSTLKRDKSSVHPTILASSGHQLRYNLWLGLRMALQDQRGSLADERDKLQAVRNSFTDFPKKVLEFRFDCDTMESEMKAVSVILDEYHYILDLYPSRRALEEDLTGFSQSIFLTRINALQAWKNLWSTAEVVYDRFMYLNDKSPFYDESLPMESQPMPFFLDVIQNSLHRLRYESFSKTNIHYTLAKIFDGLAVNAGVFQNMNLTEHLYDIRMVLTTNTAFEATSALALATHIFNLERDCEEDIVDFASEIMKKIDLSLVTRRLFLAHIPEGLNNPIYHHGIQIKVAEAVLKFVEFMKHRIITSKTMKLFRLMGFIENLWSRMEEIGKVAPSMICPILSAFCQLELLFIEMLQGLVRNGASPLRTRPADILRRPLVHLFEFITMLRCYVAKVAEVRGDLVPKEVLFKKLLEDEFALVSTKATTSRGFCIFASPGLWRNEERLQSFTNAVAQCIYESGFHPDSCAYVVMFPTVSPEEWRGHRISLQGNAFKCLKFPSDLSFQIFPDSAFPVAPYNSWLASLDSVTREVRLRNKITAPSETVTSETISLALSTMQLTEASLCQVKNVADVKVVHRTFYFLSTFGVTLSELVGVGHKDQTALRVKLVLLAGNWAIFSHKKHPLLQDSEMRKAATQTLDFFTAMSSDSKLLDQLSDQDFAFFSSSASLCLRDVTDTETLISSHGENAFEPVFYQAHRGTETPRGQRVMMGIQRLDERQRVSTKAGRVLDTHSSSMDLNLARLSSEAPKARVKWQRGRFISKGATGSVYLASNLDTGTYMAVKEIFYKAQKEVERLRQSEQILTILHHPNVTMYYGVQIHRDRVFLLMEYCPGSLDRILKQGRIEDEGIIKKYVSQMLQGLQYLHSQGIVHHDVKPSNILFDEHGTLKFVDFGCAELKRKNAIVGDSDAFKLAGTARYLPPEVVRNEPDSLLSSHDVWAFGCTIVQMATGKIPWYELDNEWAVMFQLGLGKIPSLPTKEELSSLGVRFIEACLTQAPIERPTSEQLMDHEWLRTIA